MTKEQRRIDVVAQAIYNANYKELPDGRFPPLWQNISNEVRDFVRKQAVAAIEAAEEYRIEQSGS